MGTGETAEVRAAGEAGQQLCGRHWDMEFHLGRQEIRRETKEVSKTSAVFHFNGNYQEYEFVISLLLEIKPFMCS